MRWLTYNSPACMISHELYHLRPTDVCTIDRSKSIGLQASAIIPRALPSKCRFCPLAILPKSMTMPDNFWDESPTWQFLREHRKASLAELWPFYVSTPKPCLG